MSRLFTQLRLRLRSLFGRSKVEPELDEELQYHLEREIDEGLAKDLCSNRGTPRYAAGAGGHYAKQGRVPGRSASELFGVGAMDTLMFAAAPLEIMFVVLVATFVPALRAMRISPVVALRYE